MDQPNSPVSDYADPLYGIRGWLLVYMIGPVGLNLLFTIMWMPVYVEADIVGFAAPIVLLNVIALFSLFIEKPWVRIYQIFFTLSTAALNLLEPSPAAAVMIAWAIYWFVSKRVKRTYCKIDA